MAGLFECSFSYACEKRAEVLSALRGLGLRRGRRGCLHCRCREIMLLNAFDPVQGRTVVLNAGDLFAEAIDVDLLVISAWDGFYQPQAGSMIAALHERFGFEVGSLLRQLDLTVAETIRA